MLVALWLGLSPPLGADDRREFFEKKIRPALIQHCYKCHSAEAEEIKSGLRVDSRDGLRRGESGPAVVPGKLDESYLLAAIANDREFVERAATGHDSLESAIRNYELAFTTQTSVPEATAIDRETEQTLDQYGVTSQNPLQARYARQCLLARRMLERGVRFVELTCAAGIRNVSPWDLHSNIRVEHQKNADIVDRPIAALLNDLKARGLWDDTLVVWAGEFGRTPFAQGSTGRDHNPQGFRSGLPAAVFAAG